MIKTILRKAQVRALPGFAIHQLTGTVRLLVRPLGEENTVSLPGFTDVCIMTLPAAGTP